MLKGSELIAGVGALLSVTVTVKVKVLMLVGVPVRDPSLPRLRPGGRLLGVVLHVSGRNPPVALKLYGPYGVPSTPAGGAGMALRASTEGLLMTICVASGGPLAGFCALSVAVTENENEPIWVGVPDTVPSLPSMSPGGSAPLACHVYGGEPPFAVKP
jgi:hypothetical protein